MIIRKIFSNMKTYSRIAFIAVLATVLFSSCVGKKKFVASETSRLTAEEQIKELTATVESQNRTIDGLESLKAKLEADTAVLGKQIREYRQALTSNLSEQEKLSLMLNSQMETLAERERTINDLKAIIRKQNDMVNSLLSQVTDALIGFNSDELTVQLKNGKVYVAMSDKLLFKSGSADVDKRGKEALSMLANVITKQADIDIQIEGHTDNVPIRTARFTDNWDLSVLRATSVVRILTGEYKVNPLQITPSGRSQFFPVDDNTTVEGRSKNRRTEIILSPKLDKLFQLLNEHQAG
jgi:chemotaxis protein MotB